MSRQSTTRAQVSGYRFGVMRAEHALIRRDARMLADPMRAQWRALSAGAVLAVLLLAGAGIYGIIRPAPSVADAKIVAGAGGGLYVLVDDVMHPVSGLASARLVVGSALPVRAVGDRALSAYPRGAPLGIPGAPTALPGPADPERSVWTVCDDPAGGTAVLAGPVTAVPAAAGTGVLVRSGDDDWLLYRAARDGVRRPVRARVSGTAAVRRALHLDEVTARPVSAALLNTFPAEPELAVPEVPGRGGAGPGGLRQLPVGSVIRVRGADDAPSYFVVLGEGVQPLTEPAAEMLRAADPLSGAVPEVSPGLVATVPVVRRLPLDGFPERPPVPVAGDSVLCRSTAWGQGAAAREELLVPAQLPVPGGGRVVPLGTADGPGPGVDGAYLRPGTGEHVVVPGGSFYVTDGGVRHRLADAGTAEILGLGAPRPAPWAVLSLLPAGPDLSREAALTARDVPPGAG